jgi:hypothetical protein
MPLCASQKSKVKSQKANIFLLRAFEHLLTEFRLVMVINYHEFFVGDRVVYWMSSTSLNALKNLSFS